LECRRKSASGLIKADLRPHSSKFSHLLILQLESFIPCHLRAGRGQRRSENASLT